MTVTVGQSAGPCHEVVLCDPLDHIDLGGGEFGYDPIRESLDLGRPTIQQQRRAPSETRREERPVSYLYGNRPIRYRFLVYGQTTEQLESRIQRVTRLLERASRSATRTGMRDAGFGYFRLRLANSSRVHWARIMTGGLSIPATFQGYDLIEQGEVFISNVQLDLDCGPAFLDSWRPVMAQVGAAETPLADLPSGTPITNTRHYHVGESRTLNALGGVLSAWFHVGYDFTIDPHDRTLIEHELGYLTLIKTTLGNLTLRQVESPTYDFSTSIALTATNFGVGRHHIAVQWGDVVGLDRDGNAASGLRVWLDGVPSTSGDAGLNQPFLLGGAAPHGMGGGLSIGAPWAGGSSTTSAIGSVDDVRVYRAVDGIELDSVPWLFANGIEADAYELCTAQECVNSPHVGVTTPAWTDVLALRGDLQPELRFELQFGLPRASTTAVGVGRVWLANRVAPEGDTADTFTVSLDVESPTYGGIWLAGAGGAFVTGDAYATGTDFLRSTGAAAAGALTEAGSALILAERWIGACRILGVVRRNASASNSVQLYLTQGGSSYRAGSDVVSLDTTAVGEWTTVDFGQFLLPVWNAPTDGYIPTNLRLWDDGRSGASVDWGSLKFLYYERLLPLWLWKSKNQLVTTVAAQQAVNTTPNNPGPAALTVQPLPSTTSSPGQNTPDGAPAGSAPPGPTVTVTGAGIQLWQYAAVGRLTFGGATYDTPRSGNVTVQNSPILGVSNYNHIVPPTITPPGGTTLSGTLTLRKQPLDTDWQVINNTTSSFNDDGTLTPVAYTPLLAPSGSGSGGSTGWQYALVRRVSFGDVQYDSAVSAVRQVINAATLDATHWNAISVNDTYTPTGATHWTWLILRRQAGSSTWNLLTILEPPTVALSDYGQYTTSTYTPLLAPTATPEGGPSDDPAYQGDDLLETDRLVFDGPDVYRWSAIAGSGGYISLGGKVQGAVPQLLPGVVNRLAAHLDRDDGDHHQDDSYKLFLEVRAATLALRGQP